MYLLRLGKRQIASNDWFPIRNIGRVNADRDRY